MKIFELREWTIPPDGIDQAPVHTFNFRKGILRARG
jgi:hypothetical protein